MRTVLIGADIVRDLNGNLKVIEINTNLGYDTVKAEKDTEVVDLTALQAFILEKGFVKITYIGNLSYFGQKLKKWCLDKSIEVEVLNTLYGSITIPYVEDAEDHLIIRSAYDTTALVDDTYCRDKIEFMSLIKDQSFGSQFAYRNTHNQVVSNISNITDNGNHPNFILKARNPQYDKTDLPKLYKIDTLEELDTLLQTLDANTFVMEYHYNSDYNFNGLTTVIRSLQILYPPDLNSITVGQYSKLASLLDDGNDVFDETTHELQYSDRNKYLSDASELDKPHLLDSDKVEMADGTFKTASDLQMNDVVKTIKFANTTLDGFDQTYVTDLNNLISGSVYESNRIVNKIRVNKWVGITRLTFTDGSSWHDTVASSYLVVKGDVVVFRPLEDNPVDGITVGDQLALLDTSAETPVFVFKEIATITTDTEMFGGWLITVEYDHVFLTSTEDSTSHISYVAIEHNAGCNPFYGGCRVQGSCTKGYQCCPRTTSCYLGLCQTSCSGTYNGTCC